MGEEGGKGDKMSHQNIFNYIINKVTVYCRSGKFHSHSIFTVSHCH